MRTASSEGERDDHPQDGARTRYGRPTAGTFARSGSSCIRDRESRLGKTRCGAKERLVRCPRCRQQTGNPTGSVDPRHRDEVGMSVGASEHARSTPVGLLTCRATQGQDDQDPVLAGVRIACQLRRPHRVGHLRRGAEDFPRQNHPATGITENMGSGVGMTLQGSLE